MLPAIVINYLICVITGLAFTGNGFFETISAGFKEWMWFAIGLGIIFLSTFYLMAYITHKFSISVSSISAKISLVIPVLFSLFVLKTRLLDYDALNYFGIVGALGAIIFSSWKGRKIDQDELSKSDLWLPFLLFFANGTIDTTINFVSNKYLNESEEAIFPIIIFLTAGVLGTIILLVKRIKLSKKIWIGGIGLGVINYFSVFTLVRALSAHNDDGAFVYPVVNLGIIVLASVISMIFFHERFSRLNWIGFCMAIISLILLSHQALFT